MRLELTSHLPRTALCGLCIVMLSGCAALEPYLPYNNMCPPNGRQACTTCHTSHTSPMDCVPTVAAASRQDALPDLSALQDQVDSLEQNDAMMQEQMASLDEHLDTQREQQEDAVKVMKDLTAVVAGMRRQLDEHQRDVANASYRIAEQRTQNEQILTSIERDLLDLAKQLEEPTRE